MTLRLPREGRYWLLAAALFWCTGVFKGINLITLLASVMIAAWVLQGVGARRRLGRLRLRRWIDRPVCARTPAAVEVEVAYGRRGSLVGVRLEDRGPDHRLSWFIPWLRGTEPVRFRGQVILPRRGRYPWGALTASSGYPLGLIEARVTAGPPEPVVVFPQLGRLHRGRLRRFLSQSVPAPGPSRRRPCRNPAAHSDVHGVRSFRSGDSPRWIHWRTTARRSELMVREFDETLTDNLVLVLDPWVAQKPGVRGLEEGVRGQESGVRKKITAGGGWNAGAEESDPALEDAVSMAATVCWEWCRQKGDQLMLAVAGRPPLLLQGTTGTPFALELLECLAGQAGHQETDADNLEDLLAETAWPAAPVLLISTRESGLRESLSRQLRRPVAFVNVSSLVDYDFYERPDGHAK